VTTQKTPFFIVTAVKTSNLTLTELSLNKELQKKKISQERAFKCGMQQKYVPVIFLGVYGGWPSREDDTSSPSVNGLSITCGGLDVSLLAIDLHGHLQG
jgi:hypothetical protein